MISFFFQEDSSSTSNVPHNSIKGSYNKNISCSNKTNSYYGYHSGTNGYSDKCTLTNYQNEADHSETIANESSPSSSEHVNHDAELGML